MKLLIIFILCSAFIAFKPERVGESIVRRPERVTAFAAVHTASGTTGGATSKNITLSSTTTGNLVVVSISIEPSKTLTSVTDDKGNTYALSSPATQTNFKTYQAYAVQITGGVTTVTVTPSASSAMYICVDEYSGGNSTSNAGVFDATASATGNGTSASVTLSPSASGKLIVATLSGYSPSGWTAGASYTLYGNANFAGIAFYVRSQYRLSGTTSETAPATVAFNTDNQWQEIATSFNAYTAAPTNTGGFFNFFKP